MWFGAGSCYDIEINVAFLPCLFKRGSGVGLDIGGKDGGRTDFVSI